MKKIVLIAFTSLLCSQSFAQKRKSTATQHTPPAKEATTYSCPNFRDMKWGTHKDSIMINGALIPFIKSTSKTDSAAWYITDDDMVIGTVTCKNIFYYFNASGRLNRVKMVVPKTNKGEMMYILTNKFEEPTGVTDMPNGYQKIWNNIDEVRLIVTYFEDHDFLTIEFNSDFENVESKKINRSVSDF
jgi:hypothetical protein